MLAVLLLCFLNFYKISLFNTYLIFLSGTPLSCLHTESTLAPSSVTYFPSPPHSAPPHLTMHTPDIPLWYTPQLFTHGVHTGPFICHLLPTHPPPTHLIFLSGTPRSCLHTESTLTPSCHFPPPFLTPPPPTHQIFLSGTPLSCLHRVHTGPSICHLLPPSSVPPPPPHPPLPSLPHLPTWYFSLVHPSAVYTRSPHWPPHLSRCLGWCCEPVGCSNTHVNLPHTWRFHM